MDQWIHIAKDSAELPIHRRKQFLEKAAEKAHQFADDSLSLHYLSKVSLGYKQLKDSLKFREMNQKVLERSQKARLYTTLGESHWDLAVFLKSHGIMDSAYLHYRAAYKSFGQLPVDSTSRSLKGRMMYGLGRIQDYYRDYLGAEESIIAALKTFIDLKDHKRIYNCYNMLGIIAGGMKNYEKSLEYYEKAGSYLSKFDAPDKAEYLWQSQNNIAHELFMKNEYKRAKEAYGTLLDDARLSEKDPELYALALVNQAYILFKDEKNYPKVGRLLNKAININNSMGLSTDQARIKQYYAELLAAQGDTLGAKRYAMESWELAKKTFNSERHLEILKFLTNLDAQNAVAYSNEYYGLSEKIKDEERAIRDKFARIRMETDAVAEENKVLSRQRQIWIRAVLGLLFLGIVLFTIISQRISNNKLKFEQKQQESNQEIYNLMLSQHGKLEEGKKLEQKRISEELHDGVLGDMLGIRLMLGSLNEKDDDESKALRTGFLEKLRVTEEEIRNISHELNSASQKKMHNFIVSIKEMIDITGMYSGIACNFVYDESVDWDALEGGIKINTYRIVQELLKNAVKHSKCKNAKVIFGLKNFKLCLVVFDDGIGFNFSTVKQGIGLRNIVSRVKKIKGTLNVESKKSKGTTITISIPHTHMGQNDAKIFMERKKELLKAINFN